VNGTFLVPRNQMFNGAEVLEGSVEGEDTSAGYTEDVFDTFTFKDAHGGCHGCHLGHG
jgi:hypothetical protein